MAHVQPGDVVFFKPLGVLSHLNVLGQTLLTRRLARWSHVAMCVKGPLVSHATPRHKDSPSFRGIWLALTGAPSAGSRRNLGANQGGAHLELLEHEYVSGATFTLMRPSAATEAGFEGRLQEATTYWLAQQYSFLPIYLKFLRGRAAALPGRSFCSFLVQQIFARIGIDRFGVLATTVSRALMPGELFGLLSSDHTHWQLVEGASLAGTDSEKDLTDTIRRSRADPSPDLVSYLAEYKTTMATLMLVAQGRILQIQQVQAINRVVGILEDLRRQVASAIAEMPATAASSLINDIQSKVNPLFDTVSAELGAAPQGELLFMNYRSLVTIVLTAKGSGNIKLENHWLATRGGGTLTGPDEDFVNRYIASQNAIVTTLELRRLGVWSRSLDARWDLPSDLTATLAMIQDDVRRLDACRISDWQTQRESVRALLIRMQDLVLASMTAQRA